METGFIQKETKENSEFQTLLANLALADANHDFSEIFNFTEYNKPLNTKNFNIGLPKEPSKHLDEKGSVSEVLNLEKGNDLNSFITNTNTEQNIIIHYNKTTVLHTYNAIKYVPTQKYWEGADFMEKTGIGQKIAIIVDFAQSHFMECLVNGANNDTYEVHYLMTPELVNDPAGKPNIHDVKLFGEKTSGVNVKSYLQTINPEDINIQNNTFLPTFYSKFNETNADIKNNFFSNYSFELSPIKQVFLKKKAENLVTSLTISDGIHVPEFIPNGKVQNSITPLKKWIQSLFGKTSTEDIFKMNTKFQQKRSGDWFQALCCLDIKNRKFNQILPTRETKDTVFKDTPVYLVTHDQILLAYALLNGVNVIYISVSPGQYPPIYVFKNFADETTKSKPIAMFQFTDMKTVGVDITDLLKFGNEYQTLKDTYINSEYPKEISDLENKLKSLLNLKLDNTDFQADVKKNIIDIFSSAIQICFIEQNIIDIDIQKEMDIFTTENKDFLNNNILTESEDKKDTFFKNGSENAERIATLYKSFNILQNIKYKFNVNNQINIENWINNGFTKIKELSYVKKIDLLVSEKDHVVKYSFLTYVKNLSKSNKKLITDAFSNFKNIMDNYKNKFVDQKKTDKFYNFFSIGRTGFFTKSEAKFYNNVDNLISNVFHFLGNNIQMGGSPPPKRKLSETSIGYSDKPSIDYSTENIINSDFQEIGQNKIVIDTNRPINYDLMTINILNYIEEFPDNSISKLDNYNWRYFVLKCGYHPLLPIYMLLSVFYCSLTPDNTEKQYPQYYIDYYNLIRNIAISLINMPFENNIEFVNKYYSIGCGLCYMLFTSCNAEICDKMKEVVIQNFQDKQGKQDKRDLNVFFITNNSLVSIISGYINVSNAEITYGKNIKSNLNFTNFITNSFIPNNNEKLDYNQVYHTLNTVVQKINEDYKFVKNMNLNQSVPTNINLPEKIPHSPLNNNFMGPINVVGINEALFKNRKKDRLMSELLKKEKTLTRLSLSRKSRKKDLNETRRKKLKKEINGLNLEIRKSSSVLGGKTRKKRKHPK